MGKQSKMGFFRSLFSQKEYEFVDIEYSKKGMFMVQGVETENAQRQLKILHKQQKQSKKATFSVSLTPPCLYQKTQGWPTPPFINVNLIGAIKTEDNNWLGYIDGDKNEHNHEILILLQGLLTEKRATVKASTFTRHDNKIGLWVFISKTSLKKRLDEAKMLRR